MAYSALEEAWFSPALFALVVSSMAAMFATWNAPTLEAVPKFL